MNTPHIRHAWFPPQIPKRKHSLDAESEWPSAYQALSGPTPSPRPAKRIRALEGGLAGLSLTHGMNGVMSIDTSVAARGSPPGSSAPVVGAGEGEESQIHDVPLGGDAEPYISSIYEWASPHPTTMSSTVSLPLRGEVSEASSEDEAKAGEARGTVVNVNGRDGMLGYSVYEPEAVPEKRKRGDEIEMDDDEGEREVRIGKKKWYEPEKDRIVILDLDSSEDESTTRSPRRRRSAFSLSSSSSAPSSPSKENGRPRSQTDADGTEYVISPALLSHIPVVPDLGSAVSIPREEDPGKAIVLFRPAPWGTGVPIPGEEKRQDDEPHIESPCTEEGIVEMEASPLMSDEDAMDLDP